MKAPETKTETIELLQGPCDGERTEVALPLRPTVHRRVVVPPEQGSGDGARFMARYRLLKGHNEGAPARYLFEKSWEIR